MQTVWVYVQDMWQQAWQGDVQGVLFWIAVYCALVGLVSLVFQLRVRRWPSVLGELAQAGVVRWGGPEMAVSDQDYRLDALYRYRVGGRVYEGHRISPWIVVASHNARFVLEAQLKGVQRHADGSVAVFYNPKRPHKSYLIQPGVPGVLVTWVIILGPALYYWNRFYAG